MKKSDIVRERLAALPAPLPAHPIADIPAKIDSLPVTGRKRSAARDKKRLPKLIHGHYRASKRHYLRTCRRHSRQGVPRLLP
jgi:hypothetical protein